MSDVGVGHIYGSMVEVKLAMAEVGLPKGRQAPKEAGGYRFRGVDDLYAALCRLEAQHNVMAFPRIVSERTEYQEKNGKIQTHVHLTMEIKFVSAVDGSSEIASAIGEGIDTGDKASGKAQSNAIKQAHLEVYKIPTEGDNDIESSYHEVGQRTGERESAPNAHEQAIANMFDDAVTAAHVAEAEIAAAKAVKSGKVVNGGRERLLRKRGEAMARIGGST